MPNQYTGPTPVLDRVWSHIDRSGGPDACWPWTRATRNGYGSTWHQGKTWLAHRLLNTILYGPIPDGIRVLHTCDNPPCCNPAHHVRGTSRDNTHDMLAKNRQRKDYKQPNLPRGEQHPHAILSEDLVRTLRARYVPHVYGTRRIAREFGLNRSTVEWVVLGPGWRHVQ